MAVLTPASVFRRYEIDGVPDSGAHDPKKSEIIQLLEQMIGSSTAPAVVRPTKAALDLVTPASATYGGLVLNDPDPTKNGYYYRSASLWVKGRGFPDSLASVSLSGSATAQSGVVQNGVSPSDAVVFFAWVATPNTGPLTLTLAGASREVVNAAGMPLSAGEWRNAVLFTGNDDGKWQLLNDANAAISAAESAASAYADRLAAEQAKIDAEEAAASGNPGAPGKDGEGYLRGYGYANNATDANNDIDIAPGSARDRDGTTTISIAVAMTKRLDANWSAGTNQGGLDAGSKANNTWYNIHVIENPTSGVKDCLLSTSMTNPVMPSGFTKRRWLGAVRTDDSGNILPFLNDGDWFWFKTDFDSVPAAGNNTTTTLRQLTVPPGAKAEVETYCQFWGSSGDGWVSVRDPDRGAFTPTAGTALTFYAAGVFNINTRRLITDNVGRVLTGDTNANGQILMRTLGWRIDRVQYR